MNVFLNTNIQNSGFLADTGNIGLAPVRYFLKGKTIRIVNNNKKIHSVVSFAEKDVFAIKFFEKELAGIKHSKTDKTLKTSPKNFFKTIAMIVFLIPGLIFGTIAKAFSYLSKNVRENHKLVKEFLKPYNITIGSKNKKLNYEDAVKELKKWAWTKSKNTDRKLGNLIVYGDNLEFNYGWEFRELKPKKLILINCKIVNKPCRHSFMKINNILKKTGKWLYNNSNVTLSKEDTLVTQVKMPAVEAALKNVRPKIKWYGKKRYHVVYLVNDKA